MSHDVTSWFVEQTLKKQLDNIVRKFTIGSSEYGTYVMKWPSFKTAWDEVKATNVTLQLANNTGQMNFLRTDKTTMRLNSSIKFGFTHPTSGDETITLFTGKIDNVRYRTEFVDITLKDKFQQLTERVVGDPSTPVTFTDSNYLPADLAWYLVTSFGGFDATTSTANTDIDWDSWLAWRQIFSQDTVTVQASFNGQKVSECIRKISRQTFSSIYVHDNKLMFNRFSLADSNVSSFTDSSIVDLELEYDEHDIINRQYVYAGYSITSDYHTIVVYDDDTTSINTFGLKEETEKDESVWYVDSGSALNAAQRVLSVHKNPFDKLSMTAPLIGANRLVGETIAIVDSFHSIDESYRVMAEEINLDTGRIRLMADRSQVHNAFVLDTSTLNSNDILT